MREHRRGHQAEHHQGEIFRGPNFRATSASGGAATAMIMVATQPAKNEPIAAIASAGPARPWRANLVAVEAGDDRGGFAGQVDKNRGGRAAVLCAVVDAGEHDQRARRFRLNVIGSNMAMVATTSSGGGWKERRVGIAMLLAYTFNLTRRARDDAGYYGAQYGARPSDDFLSTCHGESPRSSPASTATDGASRGRAGRWGDRPRSGW